MLTTLRPAVAAMHALSCSASTRKSGNTPAAHAVHCAVAHTPVSAVCMLASAPKLRQLSGSCA